MNNRSAILVGLVITFIFWTESFPACAQHDSGEANSDSMLAMLLKRVEDNPDHSDSWRLLGKIYERRGLIDNAIDAYVRSLYVMFDNAAAHHDLGLLMSELGRDDAAQYHFHKVFEISPTSDYAQRLMERGVEVPEGLLTPANPIQTTTDGDVTPASYQIQTFDGSDAFDRRLETIQAEDAEDDKRLGSYLEYGVLYNSNVTLTPISRQLANIDAAGAQLFINPEIEWAAVSRDSWRAGPQARGYFTLNESHLSSLNLASFQPGAFFEREVQTENRQWIGRLDYLYSLDFFDGDRLGDRHSLTTSLTSIAHDGDIVYAYASFATSNFTSDGSVPATESLDGLTYTVGASRYFLTPWCRLPTWTLGMDLESADTEGADYRYRSIRFYGDATLTLTDRLNFVASSGIGYRDYPDFTGTVSRNEFTWRVGGRLGYQVNSFLSVSLVANYDRFESENVEFDVDRFTGGIVSTLRY